MTDPLRTAAQAIINECWSGRDVWQPVPEALLEALRVAALASPSPRPADRLKALAQRFVDEVREDGRGPFMAANFLSWGEFSGEACDPAPPARDERAEALRATTVGFQASDGVMLALDDLPTGGIRLGVKVTVLWPSAPPSPPPDHAKETDRE